jgi:hypothetical protein
LLIYQSETYTPSEDIYVEDNAMIMYGALQTIDVEPDTTGGTLLFFICSYTI